MNDLLDTRTGALDLPIQPSHLTILLPALGALAFARPLRPNPILDTQEHA